jgi:hypothetical protein
VVSELRAVRAVPEREPGRFGKAGAFSHLLISRRVKHMNNSVDHDHDHDHDPISGAARQSAIPVRLSPLDS